MRSFYQQIDRKLAAVQGRAALPSLLRSIAAHWAKPNGIFAWDHVDMDARCARFYMRARAG
jgi:DNA polymerase III subunit epsilon